jgi:hypothetical protein
MAPIIKDGQYTLAVNTDLLYFIQKFLQKNNEPLFKSGDIVVFYLDNDIVFHKYYLGKVMSGTNFTDKELNTKIKEIQFLLRDLYIGGRRAICTVEKVRQNECIIINMGKPNGDLVYILPQEKIDGIMKYIIWDPQKKKYIGPIYS